MDTMERFLGSFLGGATGDALGLIVKFDDWYTIRKRYGPYGLRTIIKSADHGRQGIVSDGTQMALFTSDGVLWAFHDHLPISEGVYRSYLRWYYTQAEEWPREGLDLLGQQQSHEVDCHYDIMKEENLFSCRTKGVTRRRALARFDCLQRQCADNESKGNSALFSGGPIGLAYSGSPDEAYSWSLQCSRMTHGNIDGPIACGTFGAIVALLSEGCGVVETVPLVMRILNKDPKASEVRRALIRAVDEAATDRDTRRSMKRIGMGWTAEETLALAVYCLLKTESCKDAVIMACNQDGDSSACGLVCGTMAGALYGSAGIPKSWLNKLECRELMERLAQGLYEVSSES